MSRTHRIEINGVVRDLPIQQVPSGVSIAYLNIEEDADLTEAAALALVELVPIDVDVLVMPSGKATGLLTLMSLEIALPIVVIQKKRKPTMLEPVVSVEYVSITSGPQTFYVDARSAVSDTPSPSSASPTLQKRFPLEPPGSRKPRCNLAGAWAKTWRTAAIILWCRSRVHATCVDRLKFSIAVPASI